ncbi:hypothetical protein J1605_020249 [Eschrichtius robustus]|uniref:Uncharacterized protein n=1 Tax=Eschrichtius robustus TaxID=9764 RepID=A0AB34HKH3_ESCRO|nr:hypothetical protein J1605_020249 [Eschrichtius robustus]
MGLAKDNKMMSKQVTKPRTLPSYKMKLNFCFLLLLLLLLQMTIPGSAQCSLDAIVDKKIKDALTGLDN